MTRCQHAKSSGKSVAAAAAMLAGALALGSTTRAQDWPTRPVTMVAPAAAGGPVDVLGRILAERLGEVLGQRIVVENVTGAGGVTGVLRVARATPDGYQFVLGGVGTMAFTQTLYKKPPYNATADFAPVALMTEQPLVLITRPDFPANDLQGFIAYLKQNAAKMRFGSGGVGSAVHFGCALLNATLGVETTHIPYRGSGPAMPDLMAGRIDYFCETISTALPHIRGHAVKAIAVLARARSPVMPNLRTADEQGLTGFDTNVWNGFFLPAGTPEAVVRHLHDATVETLDTAAVRDHLEALGITIVSSERRSPGYLAKFVASEIEKWAAAIKATGVTAD